MGKVLSPFVDKKYLRFLMPLGAKVLLAASGGIDSTVCAHYLHSMMSRLDIQIALAYIHHGLRPEADEEELFVNCLAGSLKVPFFSSKIEPGHHAGVQNRAREMRYDALGNMAKEKGYDLIATAHNMDDQAETVLYRLFRGSGIGGLSGILPKRGAVIRPLLFVSRKAIHKYAEKEDLPYLEDKSNYSDKYTRNRIRKDILPKINQIMGYDIRPVAGRIAKVALLEREVLEDLAKEDLKRAIVAGSSFNNPEKSEGLTGFFIEKPTLSLNGNFLKSLSKGRRMGVYRAAIKKAKGNLLSVTTKHLESIDHLLRSKNPSAGFEIWGKIVVGREYDRLIFSKPTQERFSGERVVIEGNGDYVYGAIKITVIEGNKFSDIKGDIWHRAFFPKDAIRFPITVRGREKGDRVEIMEGRGSKKLSRVFIDKKTPKNLRDKIPVFLDSKGIFWAPGVFHGRKWEKAAQNEIMIRIGIGKIE